MDKSVRVMLVDDEPDFIEPIAFWLQSKGYTVVKAPNGKVALEMIKQHTPDIMFLDINMPEMDGLETLKNLRAFNTLLPVIIVTAAYQDEAKFSNARQLGISGFVPKQSSLSELVQVLEVTLRTHGKLKAGNE